MDLISKQLGPEANVKAVLGGGKISLVAALDTQGFDANLSISVDSDYFLDELAKKIPGALDDAILAVLKTAIKAL